MLQWDAVDTSPDWGGGENVLKTFYEIAIRHSSRTTRTELEFGVFLSLGLLSLSFKNISLAPIAPTNPPPCSQTFVHSHDRHLEYRTIAISHDDPERVSQAHRLSAISDC